VASYCQKCGDGVQLGNRCKSCDQEPFCEECSEKNSELGRVCNDCKYDRKLDCQVCQKLSSWFCMSCEKGNRERISRTCNDHSENSFHYTTDDDVTWNYFECNTCGGTVCLNCVIKEGLIRKHYLCRTCGNELLLQTVR